MGKEDCGKKRPLSFFSFFSVGPSIDPVCGSIHCTVNYRTSHVICGTRNRNAPGSPHCGCPYCPPVATSVYGLFSCSQANRRQTRPLCGTLHGAGEGKDPLCCGGSVSLPRFAPSSPLKISFTLPLKYSLRVPPSNPSSCSGYMEGGGSDARSTEGGCGLDAQGSCGAITERCGGADVEGLGNSSGAACAGAE
jgi:hypothetical protein